ncbi:serine protease snake-like isoform X1 [Zophobas morio]|uniref:serine protease snake-like isoform X1 n=1 Tax=Zophobas morio TaxID=2755281 RepID=UPI003082D6E9
MCFVLSVFTIFLMRTVSGHQFVGDVCTLQSTGSGEVCKLLTDCPKAEEELRKNRFPQTCGFQGKQPIVCCPESQTVTPETTTVEERTPARRKPGDMSKRKCREYSRYVYETVYSHIALIDEPEVTRNECGHEVVKLIVGGEPAGRKEFPHMAAVGYEPNPGDLQWLCGGTIISNKFILTAAHCLSYPNAGDALWVRLGVNKFDDISTHRQQLKIVERIAHPEYKSNSHYHDIGLLKLEKPAKMNPYARPACLYLSPEISAQRSIATGWGQTSWGGDGSSNKLHKVIIDLFDREICDPFYRNQRKLKKGILNDIQVCAGSLDEEKDTCQVYYGGPLQIYHTGDKISCMYDIIGVSSFGKGCASSPGVYVRVSHYIKWIEDTVWP